MNNDVFFSGCRNDAPSKPVLQKISSEAKRTKGVSKDDLQGLIEIYANQEKAGGLFPGILRSAGLIPPFLIMYSHASVNIYHYITRRDILYLDATGSIMKNNVHFGCSKKFLLYDLVIRHPISGKPPLVLGSFVTTDQSVKSISDFLSSFLYSEQRLYGHNGVRNPLLIMIDGSATLLLSVLKTFTGESVSKYYQRCYRIIDNKALADDINQLFVHQCASHFIKNASRKCRKLCPKHFKNSMYWLGALVKANSIKEIDNIVFNIAIILLSKTTNQRVRDSFQKLN